jgi:hypothetical protein
MRLSAAEKRVLLKAADRPTAGLELSTKEQACLPNLRRLELIFVFGQGRYKERSRIDLQIFRTRMDKCGELIQRGII